MLNLRALVENTPDAGPFREMISFATKRLVDFQWLPRPRRSSDQSIRPAWRSGVATGFWIKRPARGRWSCGSRSCRRFVFPGVPRAAPDGGKNTLASLQVQKLATSSISASGTIAQQKC